MKFDPLNIQIGDRVMSPDGEVITVPGVLKIPTTEFYDTSLCKAAPKSKAKDKAPAAKAESVGVVIWGD